MSLADIVKQIGGDLYSPFRAIVPGPGHSPEDRSVSLMVDRDGRLVVRSFGRSTWQEVFDDLRRRGFIDEHKRLTGVGSGLGYHGASAHDPVTAAAKLRAAADIWRGGGPIADTPSERHFRVRRVERPLPGADLVRHCAAAPLRAYDPDDSRTHPALVVSISGPDGDLTAVEVTYLDRDGAKARRLKLQRKIVGVLPEGSSVRIDAPAEEMLVGEGLFTTLAASHRFDLPAEAALSTSRLVTWRPREGVRSVLVAGDNGRGGRRAARLLVERLRDIGLRARAEFPPRAFGDFDDLAQAQHRAPELAARAAEGADSLEGRP